MINKTKLEDKVFNRNEKRLRRTNKKDTVRTLEQLISILDVHIEDLKDLLMDEKDAFFLETQDRIFMLKTLGFRGLAFEASDATILLRMKLNKALKELN